MEANADQPEIYTEFQKAFKHYTWCRSNTNRVSKCLRERADKVATDTEAALQSMLAPEGGTIQWDGLKQETVAAGLHDLARLHLELAEALATEGNALRDANLLAMKLKEHIEQSTQTTG